MEVRSILDTDLYKFSVSYAYMKLFPDAEGTFEFVDRNNLTYSEHQLDMIRMQLASLSVLRLNMSEKDFMQKNCYFIPNYYFEWLESFRFEYAKIKVSCDSEGHLKISVTDKLYKVTLYEIPILCIISAVTHMHEAYKLSEVLQITETKCKNHSFKYSDFGTRRRFNSALQYDLIARCLMYDPNFVGTSNCYIAYKLNLKMMGTFPHEWVMFHGAMYGYDHANYMALENWINVYDGELGIALSDTYTSKVFFKNFSKKHARLFDGVRQDSGDPFRFIDLAIERYKELGIDPLTKTIIFSDSLNFDKAQQIANCCNGRIKCSFGIGTNLTCDVPDVKPANIVMKLIECRMTNKQPFKHCIKLSDAEGKHLGNQDELNLALNTIKQHYD